MQQTISANNILHIIFVGAITLCSLIGFPSHIDTISKGLSIVYFKGSQNLLKNNVFLSLKVVLILPNSADPDEMQHYAAFHLGLHCLSKYQFRGFQHTKGLQFKKEFLSKQRKKKDHVVNSPLSVILFSYKQENPKIINILH